MSEDKQAMNLYHKAFLKLPSGLIFDYRSLILGDAEKLHSGSPSNVKPFTAKKCSVQT